MSKKRSKRKQNKNTIVVSSLADALVTAFALTAEESPRKKGVRDRERARVRAQNPILEPKRRLTYEYEEENFDDYEPDILNEEPGFDAEAAADDEDDQLAEEDKQIQHQIEEEESFDHLFEGQSMDPLDNDMIDRGWGLDGDEEDNQD
ncbi:hypothetical protein [Lacticaseibacillus manihotivorans]|jgi:hypothetical protein|uniref:hypothetical protein n=1 Tax=Lacticaseibacillus manihotivorans TaxID=88233 RepID=UPI0006CFE484|nr:hypothetical protein [Lacticaseibacillus manihotivorans]